MADYGINMYINYNNAIEYTVGIANYLHYGENSACSYGSGMHTDCGCVASATYIRTNDHTNGVLLHVHMTSRRRPASNRAIDSRNLIGTAATFFV